MKRNRILLVGLLVADSCHCAFTELDGNQILRQLNLGLGVKTEVVKRLPKSFQRF